MDSLSEVSLEEFKEVLKSNEADYLKTIYVVLLIGLLLIVLLLFLAFKDQSNNQFDKSMLKIINIFTMINFLLMIAMFFLGKIITIKQYSRKNLKKAVHRTFEYIDGRPIETKPAEKCLKIIRISSLLQLFGWEGSAFFGIFVILLSRILGTNQNTAIYYFNLLTILPLLIYVKATFPTEERLLEIFRTKFKQSI